MLEIATNLSVSEQGDDLKFEWMTQRHILSSYCVNAEIVRLAGERVRDELRRVAKKYKNPSASYDLADLKMLARAGERLFEALFHVTAGDASSADYLKDKIIAHRRRIPLTIFTDGNVTIPWNFIYRYDADNVTEVAGDLSDFQGFWTSIFQISIRFNKMQPPCENGVPKQGLKTLFALHETSFRSARALLKGDDTLNGKLDELLTKEVGETTNWSDCRKKWKLIEESDSLVYIFGHSDGKRIYLRDLDDAASSTDDYSIDAAGLLTCFRKKRSSTSNTVYFINGCRTTDSDWGNGFLSVTSGPGFMVSSVVKQKLQTSSLRSTRPNFLICFVNPGCR